MPGVGVGQDDTWTLVADEGPAPRRFPAMTYDSTNGVTVLFSGKAGDEFVDTWTWDGFAWTLAAQTGPVGRKQSSMVHDSVRGVSVLFGGASGPGGDPLYDDTWEWDGTEWTEIEVIGPSARRWPAMAFDAARGVTVLFGGEGVGRIDLGDTWEWDGVNWVQAATTGPLPRNRHGMTYDSDRGVVLLFGGFDGQDVLGDTWEWDGVSWTQVNSGGPARFDVSLVYDQSAGVTLLYGGDDAQPESPGLSDMWQWDGSQWSEITLGRSPGGRQEHGLAYDSARDVTILFGGSRDEDPGGPWLGDTWEWGLLAIRGAVRGYAPDRAICRNVTTGEQVIVQLDGEDAWNCREHGLIVNPGDRVITGAIGDTEPE